MSPIRLAVIFDQKIDAGGGYQQALNAALLVKKIPRNLVEPIFFTTFRENISILLEYEINAMPLPFFKIANLEAHLYRLIQNPILLSIFQKYFSLNLFEKHLFRHKIDLVYFLSPSWLARNLRKINYIATVWDLCHRDNPEFPEVRWNRIFENREIKYQSILPRATAVFVDSPLGKENLIHRYGLDADQVHVMPFEAAQSVLINEDQYYAKYIDIQKKHHLEFPYIFYPAQFWPHKNHVYILEGLKILEQKHGIKIGAIFTGSDKGNLNYIKKYSTDLSLSQRVRFTGFVPNDEMPYYYRQSVALVMPTYFGPTNLPPLEAFMLEVPVLYPDKVGLRDQVGDAALLMDLTNPETMADHLAILFSNPDVSKKLIEAGKLRLLDFKESDRIDILVSVVQEFFWKRLCWQKH